MLVSGALFLLPLLALVNAQDSTNDNNNNDNVTVSTIQTVFTSLGEGRVLTTVTTDILVTITPAPASQSGGGNSGNETASGNSTAPATAGNATSISTTEFSNLPTAASIEGGGASGGAPFPGATAGCGSACGPDDNFINLAQILSPSITLIFVAIGASLLAL